jgi:glucokinase
MCYVTVSTGIGGGVVADGALFQGRGGLAAQFGHMAIVEDSPRCFCGAVGCWEAVASGSAMGWLAAAALRGEPGSLIAALAAGAPAVTARHVAEAAARGDPLALRLMRQEARHLATGFVNLLHLFSPELIVVGGGVARSLGLMRADIEAAMRERAMPAYRSVPVVAAALADHAGVVGAATLALPAAAAPP